MKIKFIDEFRTFASKGNVVDMAVGIILGAAFGKIVSSVVSDIILPPIGLLIGGVDFTDLAITLKAANMADGTPAVMWKYGNFIQTLFDFIIVAFSVFMLVKAVNKLKAKSDAKNNETAATPTPVVTKEEQLLTEIRDILKDK